MNMEALGHVGNYRVQVISVFGDVPWLPGSPDLTAPDCFLWGLFEK
jgi:hypothetical protein